MGAIGLLVAAALGLVGWFDYQGTRREFHALVRAHASSLRQTVAAAARSNAAGAVAAREELAARLVDNARLLGELDRQGGLTPPRLEEIARRNRLFRVAVVAPDGSTTLGVAPGGGPHGRGGSWRGMGRGHGPGGAEILGPLLSGERQETVTGVHRTRWGDAARIAAGVRRANGGAILLNVDAGEVAALQHQTSLDRLFADILAGTDAVAFIVFDHDGNRHQRGEVPTDLPPPRAMPDSTTRGGGGVDQEIRVAGRPVLEVRDTIDLDGESNGDLRLGMRLDGLRRAERRSLSRLAATLGAAGLLGGATLGLVWLRRAYGSLSRKHAWAEDALKRRDRLAAMGELASTVAHEIRNPLNAIAMSAQRLARECTESAPAAPTPDSEAIELVDVIQRESRRIDQKVEQFLRFARPPRLELQRVALGPFLAEIAGAIRPLAAARSIDLTTTVSTDAVAFIDLEQFRQAVDNLLRNAIEATPETGRVSLRSVSSPAEHIIEIADTGRGIEPADLPRIFDLYFTTRPEGTGVGLALTQQVVAGHGGTIEVDSTPGAGTTMRVRIPRRTADEVHA